MVTSICIYNVPGALFEDLGMQESHQKSIVNFLKGICSNTVLDFELFKMMHTVIDRSLNQMLVEPIKDNRNMINDT